MWAPACTKADLVNARAYYKYYFRYKASSGEQKVNAKILREVKG